MSVYRKKPVLVDAWQIPSTVDPLNPPPAWILEGFMQSKIVPTAGGAHVLEITTNHGPSVAGPTDWVLRDRQTGELYPCENTTFHRNYEYEQVAESTSQQASNADGAGTQHSSGLQQDAREI